MKRPIEPDDIQVGDRVLARSHGMETTLTVDHIDSDRFYARRGNAGHDDQAFLWGRLNEWELLDRPTPPVTLPEVPTLGWLRIANAYPRLGQWHRYESAFKDAAGQVDYVIQGEVEFPVEIVTGFTEAIAAPKDAYDALMVALDRLDFNAAMAATDTINAARSLRTAVDAAGEGK